MKKYLPTTFSEFITEKVQYLNLSDRKTNTTIAQFDTSNQEDLKSLKNVKTSLLKNEMELFLKELLESVNSENSELMASQLLPIFLSGVKVSQSDNLIQELREILIQKSGIYKFNMATGINNSIDDLAKFYSKYFDYNFFKELSKKQLGVRPMTGPMEGLLALFTDLSFAGAGDRGDLKTDAGRKVEVKARNGRVGGTTSHYVFMKEITENLLDIYNEFLSKIDSEQAEKIKKDHSKLFNKSGGGLTINFSMDIVDSANKIYKLLNRKDGEKFIHLIGHSLKGYRDKRMSMNEKLGPQEFDIFKSIIERRKELELIDFKSVVDFMGYKLVDNFDYLLFGIFPTTSKNNIDLKESFLVIDVSSNNFKNIYEIFRKYVKVTGAPEWHTNGTGITATTKKK